MIIQNIVDDFYRKLVPGKTVLILAGLDVDSLCALRSLIQLLQKDYIPFSLKPIRSKHHLFKTISEHKVSTQSCFFETLPVFSINPTQTKKYLQGKCDQFVLINLGATVDFLNIDEDGEPMDNGGDEQNPLINDHDELELFIIDSHRPVNLIK